MLEVRNCTLYRDASALINALNFTVMPGEILTLMGPSGIGKSTLLSWITGTLPANFHAQGSIWLNNRRCDKLPTQQRHIGIFFQDALLFAHLNVGQNLAIALPATIKGRKCRQIQVQEALNAAGLAHFGQRDPATLSGGERARISLLQTLLAHPEAILLDEPYSRLDENLRGSFRQFVEKNISQQNIPVVLVTHDIRDIPVNGRVIQL